VRSLPEAGFALLLVVAYGWVFPFFPRLNNPNELVRVYMARSIAEHSTYSIGVRSQNAEGAWVDSGPVYDEWGFVNDKALVCADSTRRPPSCAGRLYAAKAPAASFFAVPVVAALDLAATHLAHREPTKGEYVFALRWLLGILPTVALWLAVRRFLLALGTSTAATWVACLAGALGSPSLTYGQMFAGHQLSSVCLGLLFLAAFWPRPASSESPGAPDLRALLVGLGAAASICSEYQSAPAALLLLGGWVVLKKPTRPAMVWALVGALPLLAVTARFHAVSFGAPWRTPYSSLENSKFVRDLGTAPLGLAWPSWERVSGSLLSPRLGLLFWAPWVAFVLPAADICFRRARPEEIPTETEARRVGRLACLVVGYYVVFQVCHSLWQSGWTVGPRYMTPVAPFAAVAIAISLRLATPEFRRWALACFAGAGAAAIVATGLVSLVSQGFPTEVAHPLVEVVGPLLRHGYVGRNPLQAMGVPGLASAMPTLLALAAAALLCLRCAGPPFSAPTRLAASVFLLLVGIQWTWPRGVDSQGEDVAAFLAEHWEPALPPGARPFDQ
jgi:hypothetical protein